MSFRLKAEATYSDLECVAPGRAGVTGFTHCRAASTGAKAMCVTRVVRGFRLQAEVVLA
jgi:hypothetical protein